MNEPTKAPWHYSELLDEDLGGNITVDCYIVMGNNGTDLVAEVFTQSDASFIAAAPELLAALKRTLSSVCKCGSSDCYETDVRRQAEAAIAKARGE